MQAAQCYFRGMKSRSRATSTRRRRDSVTLLALWAVLLLPLPAAFGQAGKPAPLATCPWAGIYPTVVTPFGDKGIDTQALKQQIDMQLRNNVHGLLVLGTIGEGRFASPVERAQVIATTRQQVGYKVPVVVGHAGSVTASVPCNQRRPLVPIVPVTGTLCAYQPLNTSVPPT